MRWKIQVEVPGSSTSQGLSFVAPTLRDDEIEADDLRVESETYRFTTGDRLVAAYQADRVVRAVSQTADIAERVEAGA